MRQAEIYRKGILAGILTEDGGEYRFCYDEAYLSLLLLCCKECIGSVSVKILMFFIRILAENLKRKSYIVEEFAKNEYESYYQLHLHMKR